MISTTRPSPISWETLAKTFGVVVALMYATGFFITFTFLAGYGLPEFGADVFRLKYFYVGVLCSSFPLFVAIPLLLKSRNVVPQYFFDSPRSNQYARYLSRRRRKELASAPAFLTVLNMVAMIYIVIGLFNAEQYRARQGRIAVLVLCSVVALLIAKKLSSALADRVDPPGSATHGQHDADRERILNGFRIATLLMALLWDVYVCWGLGVLHVIKNGVLYALLMIAFAWRLVRLDTQLRFEAFPGPAAISGQAAIVAALYIVGCLSYAVSVYPHISVSYGGGSFTDAPNEVLCVTGTRLPAELMATAGCTVPVKVIHSTDSMVFVAPTFSSRATHASGTDLSRDWQEWDNMPRIYGIATKKIVSQVDSDQPIDERVIDRPPTPVYSSASPLPHR